MSSSVKHRRKLNTEQLVVLELLYKFRFGSNDLIAQYFSKKDRSFVFRRLAILQELGLVGKRFESSYRLRGRPAAYYLLPEGARMLGQYRDPGDEVNIKSIYKDATVSERFVDHCFAIFALYLQLMDKYGDNLEFLAKGEQLDENLPNRKPDAFLILETDSGTQHYFVDILDDDAHLLIDVSKKIKRYIDYKNSGDWVLVDQAPFPKIIFVCNSEEAAKRVQKRSAAILHKTSLLDVAFEAVTKDTINLD
jgi:hypothetical protein